MQTTRRTFLDDFLAFVGEPDDDDARDVSERLLNQAIDRIYLKHPFRQFRSPTAYEFATMAGTRSYSLPARFGRLLPRSSAWDLTDGREIRPADEVLLRQTDTAIGSSAEATGYPWAFYLGGVSALEVEASTSGTALEVLSDSASDTDIRVTLVGIDASTGRQRRQRVTLTGTTAVALGTWKPPITECGKSYPANQDPETEFTSSRGTVTVRAAVGGATYLTLAPDEDAKSLQLVNLHPIPTDVRTIALPYLLAPRRLIYDSDALPAMWGPAVWEEMLLLWRVNTGETATDVNIPRPAFVDLVRWDNAQGPPVPVQPFR
ncbi:MAG: hypothetical protein AB7G23_03070 [Vicinamibacterales bacterium]